MACNQHVTRSDLKTVLMGGGWEGESQPESSHVVVEFALLCAQFTQPRHST